MNLQEFIKACDDKALQYIADYVSSQQVYEWIRTGSINLRQFRVWVKAVESASQ